MVVNIFLAFDDSHRIYIGFIFFKKLVGDQESHLSASLSRKGALKFFFWT